MGDQELWEIAATLRRKAADCDALADEHLGSDKEFCKTEHIRLKGKADGLRIAAQDVERYIGRDVEGLR